MDWAKCMATIWHGTTDFSTRQRVNESSHVVSTFTVLVSQLLTFSFIRHHIEREIGNFIFTFALNGNRFHSTKFSSIFIGHTYIEVNEMLLSANGLSVLFVILMGKWAARVNSMRIAFPKLTWVMFVPHSITNHRTSISILWLIYYIVLASLFTDDLFPSFKFKNRDENHMNFECHCVGNRVQFSHARKMANTK